MANTDEFSQEHRNVEQHIFNLITFEEVGSNIVLIDCINSLSPVEIKKIWCATSETYKVSNLCLFFCQKR